MIVSIKNITFYSEKAVAREMDSLGANVLVLPKSATLQNYYAADMQGDTIPEEYVTQLAMSSLQGLDNLSPKLSVPVEIAGTELHADGHPAQERIPGQGGLVRGRHLLASGRLRRHAHVAVRRR